MATAPAAQTAPGIQKTAIRVARGISNGSQTMQRECCDCVTLTRHSVDDDRRPMCPGCIADGQKSGVLKKCGGKPCSQIWDEEYLEEGLCIRCWREKAGDLQDQLDQLKEK